MSTRRSPLRWSLSALYCLTFGTAPQIAAAARAQDSLQIASRGAGLAPCSWDPVCSTAGVQVALREKSRFSMGRQKLVEYELVGTGLPTDRLFTLWLFPFGERPTQVFTGVTGDSTGRIVCADSSALARANRPPSGGRCIMPFPLMMPLESFVPSEPAKAALISNDDSLRAYATVFPVPLEAETAGCRLWLELLSTDRDRFRLSGTGFQGGAEAHVVSSSGNQVIDFTKPVPADGSFWMLLSPSVKGKRGGPSSIAVSTPGCTVNLEYRWGRDLR